MLLLGSKLFHVIEKRRNRGLLFSNINLAMLVFVFGAHRFKIDLCSKDEFFKKNIHFFTELRGQDEMF